MPEKFTVNDNMIVPPASPEEAKDLPILRGPNIKPFPSNDPMPDTIEADVLLKVGDNITTDHIMPAGAKVLPLRSNIPAISQHCFTRCDPTFPARCEAAGKGFVVGGNNYGQGSSREHAALAPLHLGIKAVFVQSFARIHVANLINAGILPLTFADPADYDRISQGDTLRLTELRRHLTDGSDFVLENVTRGETYALPNTLTERQAQILLAGGLLYTIEK